MNSQSVYSDLGLLDLRVFRTCRCIMPFYLALQKLQKKDFTVEIIANCNARTMI